MLGFSAWSRVDCPDIALAVAQAVVSGKHDRGILVCGTGIGMAIAANKVPGVRAAQIHDPYSAERAAKSNNAQIATLGSQTGRGRDCEAPGGRFPRRGLCRGELAAQGRQNHGNQIALQPPGRPQLCWDFDRLGPRGRSEGSR